MIAIAVAMGLGFLILILCSRKEAVEESLSFFQNPFWKAAFYIYKKGCKWKVRIFAEERIRKDLEGLYPEQPAASTCVTYYVGKIALVMELCLAGTALATLIYLGNRSREMIEDGKLARREIMGEEEEILLRIQQDDTYHLTLHPYMLNEEEAEKLYRSFMDELKRVMLGNNVDSEHVSQPLNLVTQLDGYPFMAEWGTDSPELVDSLGEVSGVEEPTEVALTVQVFYEDMSWQETINIRVIPGQLDEAGERHAQIQKLLDISEENSRTHRDYVLPQDYRGEPLYWKYDMQDHSVPIWCGFIGLAVVVYFLSDYDLHTKLEKRRREIKEAYTDIVQKLALYMGAGMTARNAFKKLAMDYEADIRRGCARKPAYDELLFSYRELLAGVSEGLAYEHFGKRTGLQEYIRLAALLQQNIRKGNSEILKRLKEEAEKALDEKLQGSRRLGEEAGTKLLLPMVMLLLVVMIIIMVPAFLASVV